MNNNHLRSVTGPEESIRIAAQSSEHCSKEVGQSYWEGVHWKRTKGIDEEVILYLINVPAQ
jgi:uncharacterized protein with PIN domain